jgi:hypothetical protein
MKYIKTLGNARGTRTWRCQAPTGGPRRLGGPRPSQGRPLALTRGRGAARARSARRLAAVATGWGCGRGGKQGKDGARIGDLGVPGRLTRGIDGRDSAASGGTARSRGGGGRRPASWGTEEGESTAAGVGKERDGNGEKVEIGARIFGWQRGWWL